MERCCERYDSGTFYFFCMSLLAMTIPACLGLHSSVSGITLAVKIRAACEQLGIDKNLAVPAAIAACNEAMGLQEDGPLVVQADIIAEQLGLSFESPPVPAANEEECGASGSTISPSVYSVMSAPMMVHSFSSEVMHHTRSRYLSVL